MSRQQIQFYDWPWSPFCMKVRLILDFKRLPYDRVNPLARRGFRRRRGTEKVPAVEIDGAFVTDSTDSSRPGPMSLAPTHISATSRFGGSSSTSAERRSADRS